MRKVRKALSPDPPVLAPLTVNSKYFWRKGYYVGAIWHIRRAYSQERVLCNPEMRYHVNYDISNEVPGGEKWCRKCVTLWVLEGLS
jgi:hypothetical protein